MRFIAALIIVLFCLTINTEAQTIPLPEKWLYQAGDDSNYKNPAFDDHNWTSIVLNNKEAPLTIKPEHSYGWFRVHFDIPANLRSKDLMFLLGTIDDVDETYLNGVLIGSTGKFPPADQSAWDVQRTYTASHLLFKEHNTIAIRVYNAGVEGGISAKAGEYAPYLSYLPKDGFAALVKKLIAQKNTYNYLTTSNGLIAAVYNSADDKIVSAWPHIFNAYDSGKFVQPFATDIKLSGNHKPVSAGYLANTHIIEVKYNGFTVDYFAPFTTNEKMLYAVIRGKTEVVKNLNFEFTVAHGGILTNSGIEKPGEKYFIFSFNDSLHQQQSAYNSALHKIRNVKYNLLSAERRYMKSVFARCHIPTGITTAERNLAEQSIAIMKMSQVGEQEIFPLAKGQILASLRPGNWAISWVRDACYAIQGMTAVGMYPEAAKGLAFMLRAAPTNQFIHYVHSDGKDYGIQVPYQISVTRYFGNGREESDYGETNGPNIEIDDFGLFLTAFSDYVKRSGDTAFLLQWRTTMNQLVNAIIVNLDDKILIRHDSGPWEHHLPGRQFVFTNAVCARGIELYATLLEKYDKVYVPYESAADKMKEAISKNYLINNEFFKGNVQDSLPGDHYYFDAASIELFANGLFRDPSLFSRHMKMYDRILRGANDPTKGYIRFNSNDSYENQEWPFAGLRVAVAQNQQGSRNLAKQQIDRITTIASRNYNQIPEIISLELQRYRGSIPMVGYGAGAYLIALVDYYKH